MALSTGSWCARPKCYCKGFPLHFPMFSAFSKARELRSCFGYSLPDKYDPPITTSSPSHSSSTIGATALPELQGYHAFLSQADVRSTVDTLHVKLPSLTPATTVCSLPAYESDGRSLAVPFTFTALELGPNAQHRSQPAFPHLILPPPP